MNNSSAQLKKFIPDAKTPKRQTAGSVGYDVYAAEEVTIEPSDTKLVPLGVGITPPKGTFILMTPRSSFAFKKNLIMANSVGIGDEDFTGEYKMAFINIGNEAATIEKHERCGQIIFVNYETPDLKEVDELKKTERGEGGFGSTGKF
jgi:dUTP pyrophosphatase